MVHLEQGPILHLEKEVYAEVAMAATAMALLKHASMTAMLAAAATSKRAPVQGEIIQQQGPLWLRQAAVVVEL